MINHRSKEDELVELLLLLFFSVLAISFLIIKVGVCLSVSFASVSYGILVALVCLVVLWLAYIYIRNRGYFYVLCNRNAVFLVLCALGAGFLTASINRYSGDDGVYLPKAVYYTEHPEGVLDLGITWVAGLPAGTNSLQFQFYETFQAAIAWLTGFKLLAISHIFFPFLVGCFVFWACYLLLGFFENRVGARLLGTVFLGLIILLLGETSRAYGTFTIARAHQGKSVLIFFGFYSWVYFSLKYFIRERLHDLISLTIVAIALCGMTTSTYVYLPLLSLIVYSAFYVSEGSLFTIRTFKIGAWYLITLLPLMIVALDYRRALLERFPDTSLLKSRFSSDFIGQLNLLVGDFPLMIILFVLSMAVIAIFSSYRKFFVAWVVIAVVLVLNPYVSEFVMQNLTTENIYWRMFYLLPFPLVCVIAVFSLLRKERYSRVFVFSVFALLAVLVLLSPTSVFRGRSYARPELLNYRIPIPARSFITDFEREMPPGSVVAPRELAVPIIIYSSKYPQYLLNDELLMAYSSDESWRTEVLDRVRASRYLYRESNEPSAKEAFERLLTSPQRPVYVIQKNESPNAIEEKRLLANHGYSFVRIYAPDYVVWKSE